MENYIRYYYNINPSNIHLEGDNYYFSDNLNGNYCLYNIPNADFQVIDLKKIYYLSNYLSINGFYCHQFVVNINNEIYIVVNNKIYVLLKYKDEYGKNKKINLENIVNFSKISIPISDNKSKDIWKTCWSVKIDYFEYQLNQFGYKHTLLRESFGYYSGLVELAIALQNILINNANVVQNTLCHKRMRNSDTLFDLYNPINFIIDNKVRDTSEYFKSKLGTICSNKDLNVLIDEIANYFRFANFKDVDYLLFFIRLLYSTAYFDNYEKIMNNNLDDIEIEIIVKKTPLYECFIKSIYKYIRNNRLVLNMPKIDWLIK